MSFGAKKDTVVLWMESGVSLYGKDSPSWKEKGGGSALRRRLGHTRWISPRLGEELPPGPGMGQVWILTNGNVQKAPVVVVVVVVVGTLGHVT